MTERAKPVAMITSSYPRFPGDGIGSFIEPIAHGVADRGWDVHVVAPWHPKLRRPAREGRVHFHFYRYAPTPGLHVFGYAAALKADVSLRSTAYLAAPWAAGMGCLTLRRVVRVSHASLVHAHWVVPGGFIAALSRTKLPLVISLHGSDVFLAESNPLVRLAARFAFRRAAAVTACSDDLRRRAVRLGAREETTTVVPYGVDTSRFKPDEQARQRLRHSHGLGPDDQVVVAAGRLVRKKGFEFLIDAVATLADRYPRLTLVVVGDGDLKDELRQRADRRQISDRMRLLGAVPQDEVANWLSAADVVVVPSVHDAAGNVDGLPNVLLEALSSGTPVVTTPAGGIGSVAVDGKTARVVPERDGAAIGVVIDQILQDPKLASSLGRAARAAMDRSHSWASVADRFENVYHQAMAYGARTVTARP
jgi:glycosyltransferase involved in cell wall biosynthesis